MAVYPIDVRGLITNQSDASIRAGESFRDISWLWRHADTMRELANQTGGEAFYNTNGLSQAMSRTLIMGRTTIQWLMCRKPGNGMQVQFHKIEGCGSSLKLQYRRGYLPLPERAVGRGSSLASHRAGHGSRIS